MCRREGLDRDNPPVISGGPQFAGELTCVCSNIEDEIDLFLSNHPHQRTVCCVGTAVTQYFVAGPLCKPFSKLFEHYPLVCIVHCAFWMPDHRLCINSILCFLPFRGQIGRASCRERV